MKSSPALIAHAVVACLTTLLLAAPVALAASGEDRTPLNLEPDAPARQAAEGGGGGGIARRVVGLAVVLGVIYGLSWVVKQVKASKEGQATGAGLEALSSLPLGPGRSVHLVRVGSDVVLLGAAEKGVTPIRTYGEDEAIAHGLIGGGGGGEVITGTLVAERPALPAGPVNVLDTLRRRTVRR